MGYHLAFGIDENTAMVYRDGWIEVIGKSGILIVDISVAEAERKPLGIGYRNIILHYLEQSDKFRLNHGNRNPGLNKAYRIDPNRKPVHRGKEYYLESPTYTDIFGKDMIKDLLTCGLGDNRQSVAEGLSFILEDKSGGLGVKTVFSKNDESICYFGKIDGRESFSVLGVKLDIIPIKVQIRF